MSTAQYEVCQQRIEELESEKDRLEREVEEMQSTVFEAQQLLKQGRSEEAQKMLQMAF